MTVNGMLCSWYAYCVFNVSNDTRCVHCIIRKTMSWSSKGSETPHKVNVLEWQRATLRTMIGCETTANTTARDNSNRDTRRQLTPRSNALNAVSKVSWCHLNYGNVYTSWLVLSAVCRRGDFYLSECVLVFIKSQSTSVSELSSLSYFTKF